MLAERQFGRVARRQLTAMRIPSSTVDYWIEAAFLHHVLPGVYAVGHAAASTEADLAAALLYAGPYAALSHASAIWWLGLDDREPRPTVIEVSTTRNRTSLRTVRAHGRRTVESVWHKGLRVTTAAQTLRDFAAQASLRRLRYALAEAEYRKLLDLDEFRAGLGRGKPGSAKLRKALARHEPQLGRTRSELERAFIELCENQGLPVPELNAKIGDMTVDALYREARLVIELDGGRGHHTVAQMKRDRARELRLRELGYVIVRYTWEQVTTQPWLVAEDLRRLLT